MGTEAILPIRLIPRLRSGFGVERSQVRGGTLDLIGRTSLPYHVNAAIGAGGMGEVYRATDMKLGRERQGGRILTCYLLLRTVWSSAVGLPQRLLTFVDPVGAKKRLIDFASQF